MKSPYQNILKRLTSEPRIHTRFDIRSQLCKVCFADGFKFDTRLAVNVSIGFIQHVPVNIRYVLFIFVSFCDNGQIS